MFILNYNACTIPYTIIDLTFIINCVRGY